MNSTSTTTVTAPPPSAATQAPAPVNKNNLEVRNAPQAVALREQLAAIPVSRQTGIQISNLGQAAILAELLVKGGYAPKGATVEYCTVAILQGALLGFNPIQSVQVIATINGRPSVFGDGLSAIVKSSPLFAGEKIEWLGKGGAEDDFGCRFTVWRFLPNGEKSETTEWFTIADAKRAGLWNKDGPWKQYPRRMLKARALSWAYRSAFPDVLQGVRSYEEERDVIDVLPEPVDPAPTEDAAAAPRGAKQRSRLDAALRIDRPAPDPAPPVRAEIPAPVPAETVNGSVMTAAKKESAQAN